MKIVSLIVFFVISCSTINQAKIADSAKLYNTFIKILSFEQDGRYNDALKLLDELLMVDKDPYLVIKKGNILSKEGRFDEAKELYLKYVQKHKDEKVYYRLSNLYRTHYKDVDSAIKYLKKAIKISEKKKYLFELANLYELKGDYSSSVGVYNKLIKIDPSSEYYYRRGVLYLKLGLEKKGIEDIKKSYEIDEYPLALYRLADYYIKKGDKAKAIEMLKKVIKAHPNQRTLSFKLGRLLMDVEKYDEALSVFKSLENSKNELIKATVLKQIAAIYFDKKEYEKSLKYFKKVLEIKKDDLQAYYFAGFLSEALNKDNDAIVFYKKALEIDSDYVQPKKRLSIIYTKRKDYKKALDVLDSIKVEDRDVDYYRLKAVIYYEVEDYKNAIDILQKGLAAGYDDEDLLFDLVINYEKLKDYKNAEKYLRRILEYNPKNATALNFLGYMFAENGVNLEEAYELINRALEIDPDNPAYIDSMGWVLYQMKKYNDAYKYLKKAFLLAPNEQEIKEHLMRVLKKIHIDKTPEDILKEKE
ncbi:tetratricopeptide repeat protein [Deferribacter abyssi]|uniref:tetratricopeptide repeat protein n=1 Tax=Deferribacter abyssi TaxID=213806 RepID=UPI003C144946